MTVREERERAVYHGDVGHGKRIFHVTLTYINYIIYLILRLECRFVVTLI